jgi:hypothetical protein
MLYVAFDGIDLGDNERALRLDGICEADAWIEILRRARVEWLPFDNLVVDGRDGTIIGYSGPMRTRDDGTMERWTADGG